MNLAVPHLERDHVHQDPDRLRCRRPEKLAKFWGLALGYVAEPPPEGFDTWEDFAHSSGIAEEEYGEVASRVDPADEGPRLYFQRVPGKTRPSAKNARQGADLERSDDGPDQVEYQDRGC